MITTNTGAKKLESSDNWREIFPNPGTGTAGAHNASVDAQDRIQAEVAPIINGKQCALGAASGDYVLLRNSTITGKSDGAYIATKAIPANTDIDSTYLGNAITGGMVNSLNSNVTTLKKNETHSMTMTDVHSGVSVIASSYTRYGKLLLLYIQFHLETTLANGNTLFKVPFTFTGKGFAAAVGLNQKVMGLALYANGACGCIGSPAQDQYYTVVISGIEAD